MKAIIVRTAANEALEDTHYACKKERDQDVAGDRETESKTKRINLIISLDGSKNFATTHEIVKELRDVDGWTEEEAEMLLDIAINKHPVRYLLNDREVKAFYQKIIGAMETKTEKARQVEAYFGQE